MERQQVQTLRLLADCDIAASIQRLCDSAERFWTAGVLVGCPYAGLHGDPNH